MPVHEETGVEPKYWKPVDGFPGWLILMDFHTGGKSPRLILSDQDRYFLLEVTRGQYPGEELRVVEHEQKKYLARKPRGNA